MNSELHRKISYPYNFLDVQYDHNFYYFYKVFQGQRTFKKEFEHKDSEQ